MADLRARFFALLLTVGGLSGLGLFAWLLTSLSGFSLSSVIVLVLLVPFAWSVISGVSLWCGKQYGRRWAPVVFATQIPIIQTAPVSYQWFTGLMAGTTVGFQSSELLVHFPLMLGASATLLLFDKPSAGTEIGVNWLALIAMVFLLRSSGSQSSL